MHWYRANKYVLSKRLKHSALMVGYRMISGREFQTVGPATEKARRPCWDGSEVLQVADGGRNANDAAEWQHWRLWRSSPTGTVVRGRSDTNKPILPA